LVNRSALCFSTGFRRNTSIFVHVFILFDFIFIEPFCWSSFPYFEKGWPRSFHTHPDHLVPLAYSALGGAFTLGNTHHQTMVQLT